MRNLDLWLRAPAQAHRQWREGLTLQTRANPDGAPYALQSQRLYLSLFGVFCRWLAGQQCSLATLDETDLRRFQDTLVGRKPGAPASTRTQRTYFAEIDRVLDHLKQMGMRSDNPAHAMVEHFKLERPLKPRSISFPRHGRVENYLASLSELDIDAAAPEDIQSVAMNLLMLESGLTLKELQKMVLAHFSGLGNAQITAPGHRSIKQRTLEVTPLAQRWLLRWMEVRQGLRVITRDEFKAIRLSGVQEKINTKSNAQTQAQDVNNAMSSPKCRTARANKLFVTFTGKSGKPKGFRSSGLVIDVVIDSAIYLSAQKVIFSGAHLSHSEQLEEKNKGPQTLRSLCCAQMLRQKIPTSEIAERMGLVRTDQVRAVALAAQKYLT